MAVSNKCTTAGWTLASRSRGASCRACRPCACPCSRPPSAARRAPCSRPGSMMPTPSSNSSVKPPGGVRRDWWVNCYLISISKMCSHKIICCFKVILEPSFTRYRKRVNMWQHVTESMRSHLTLVNFMQTCILIYFFCYRKSSTNQTMVQICHRYNTSSTNTRKNTNRSTCSIPR